MNASPTHRILAQRVRLIERHGDECIVEYPDGSRGNVAWAELISNQGIRDDQAEEP